MITTVASSGELELTLLDVSASTFPRMISCGDSGISSKVAGSSDRRLVAIDSNAIRTS